MCCLVQGVKGMRQNSEARSVGVKVLEHARVVSCWDGGNTRVCISSADFMARNLVNRVEVGCPIYDEDVKQELLDTFEISWNDNVKARVFNKAQNNAYRKNDKPKLRSQFAMYDYYLDKLEN